jgi:hypothetical protein
MLKGGQKKLDANKDGEISGDDFKLLRSKKGMKDGAVINVVKDVAEGAGSSAVASLGKAIKSILKKSDKKPEKKFKGGSIFSRKNYKQTGKI